jgi:hypothetical protein
MISHRHRVVGDGCEVGEERAEAFDRQILGGALGRGLMVAGFGAGANDDAVARHEQEPGGLEQPRCRQCRAVSVKQRESPVAGDATRSVQNCTLSAPRQFRLPKTFRVMSVAVARNAPV